MSLPTTLAKLRAIGLLRPIDAHFAAAIQRTADGTPSQATTVSLLAALVSRRLGGGSVCVDLGADDFTLTASDGSLFTLPVASNPDELATALAASGLAGGAAEDTPLALEGQRLYLRRYRDYEQTVADRLLALASAPPRPIDAPAFADFAHRFFGNDAPSLQKLAVLATLRYSLTVISGGPGTGKTFTAAAVVLAACQLNPPQHALPRLALLAPTGKAARRLGESIGTTVAHRSEAGPVTTHILAAARAARTIHSALGIRPDDPTQARFNRRNPLPVDLVIVDETSMVDLALMARLLDALPDQARLVLIGDAHQLASVEAGSVLADIVRAADPDHSGRLSEEFAALASRCRAWQGRGGSSTPWADRVVFLRDSHRLTRDATLLTDFLGAIASRESPDLAGALDALRGMVPPPQPIHGDDPNWINWQDRLLPLLHSEYKPYLTATTPAEALSAFDRFRLLAAVRDGEFGIARLNEWAEHALVANAAGEFYDHRPIIVGTNDWALGLLNGDVGILLATPLIRAFFPPSADSDTPRSFSPAVIPPHETAFAITIHRAQGSEYDHVAIVLPPARHADGGKRAHPIVTRELIYTAVTRARTRVTLIADETTLQDGLVRQIRRASGLTERIRSASS